MYAPYRAIEPPPRKAHHATKVTFNEGFEDRSINRREDIGGRVLVYCVAGTFGLLLPAYVQASTATSSWSINQIEVNDSRISTESNTSTTSENIAHIRQTTKITVSELSRVCGVSRQAVHEWINGEPPSAKNAERISELARAVDLILEAGVDASPQALRRKVSGGLSILDAIQADGKIVELAQQLVGTLARESEQRKRLANRLVGRRKPELSSTEFGTPHLDEDV